MQPTPHVHHNGTSLTIGATGTLGYARNSEVDRWRSVYRRIIKARDAALIAVLHARISPDPTKPDQKKKIDGDDHRARAYLALK